MASTGESLRRGLLLGSLTVAAVATAVFGLVELAGNIHHWVYEGGFFYGRPAPSAPEQEAGPSTATIFQFSPYTGFARRPGMTVFEFMNRGGNVREVLRRKTGSREIPDWARLTSNNFGFFSESDFPTGRSDDVFDIGIFGGSVAQWFALQGREELVAALSPWASRHGKRVRVLSLGHGGYKQPQQLLLLAYLLTVGQRFDVVINLDGFNRALARLGSLAELRVEIERLEARRSRAWLAADYLVCSLLLNRSRARYEELSAGALEEATGEKQAELLPLLAAREAGAEAIPRDWARASRMMEALTERWGGHYLHVLQPNQYYGSHAFSRAERAIALHAFSPHRPGVKALYPSLRREGQALAGEGVAFVDASGLFDEVAEPLYSDDCCHYNQLGNDLLAGFIARELLRRLDGEAAQPPPDPR
jgi:hypothetical protein